MVICICLFKLYYARLIIILCQQKSHIYRGFFSSDCYRYTQISFLLCATIDLAWSRPSQHAAHLTAVKRQQLVGTLLKDFHLKTHKVLYIKQSLVCTIIYYALIHKYTMYNYYNYFLIAKSYLLGCILHDYKIYKIDIYDRGCSLV